MGRLPSRGTTGLIVRVLITGAGGMVGGALGAALHADGHEVWGTVRDRPAPAPIVARHARLDIDGALDAVIAAARPDVVVHAAYSTDDLHRDVEAATRLVAAACGRRGVALVHLSTDAVFDGEHAPYVETDVPRPVHGYGRAKRVAELAASAAMPDVAVVRLALIAHLEPDEPDPATRWLIDASRRGEPITLFTDEVRTVVRLDDVVWGLRRLIALDRADRAGPWHLGGPEAMSRAELGRIVIDRFHLDDRAVRLGSAREVSGPRPRDVSLSCDRARARLGWAPRPVDTVTRHGQA